MFSRTSIEYFAAIIHLILLHGCEACFRENLHGSASLPTGSPYYQECKCTEPGYMANHLQWTGPDGRPIKSGPGTDADVYTEELSDGINLHIREISKTMSGTYKCVTVVNGELYVQSYSIDAYDPLYFYGTPNDQFLVENVDSFIYCRARGESDPLIWWQRKVNDSYTEIEISNGEKYVTTPDGLIIRNVSMDDAGIYKCTAQGITTGEEIDKFIKVEVTTVPEIVELRATPSPTVVVNGSLSMECIAEGIPHPDYVWKRILYQSEHTNATQTLQENNNILTLNEISPDDRGLYQCVAYNSAGATYLDIFVEVLIPPEVFDFPNVTAVEGEQAEIICNATGRSQPNVTVIFVGLELENLVDENYEEQLLPVESNFTVQRSDEGYYICNASNEVDFTSAKMYLTVLRPPRFEVSNEVLWGWEGKTIGLSCDQDSKPPAKVHWKFDSNEMSTAEQLEYNRMLLKQLNKVPENHLSITLDKNSSYGVYVCTAKNEYGEASKHILLKHGTRPSIVDNVTVTDLTATSATFYIHAAEFEGPPIIGFIAQYDEAENYNITDVHINRTWAADRPYRLSKLKPETLYYVSFAAINEVGEGAWSENVEFVTLGKSVPETPIIESDFITQKGDNTIVMLKWEAPDDNGEPIDHYMIRYCPVNESEQEIDSNENDNSEDNNNGEEKCKLIRVKSTTRAEFKDVKENTTYFFELMAHNDKGYSSPVNFSVTITAPENIETATALSAGAIIGLSVIVVLICLLLFDLLLLVWRRQGIMASVCLKKKKKTEQTLNSRDKKGLLNRESTDDGRHNGHKQFEYNKTTGTVTGKHSAV